MAIQIITHPARTRRQANRILALLTALLVMVALMPLSTIRPSDAATPLYPDLRPAPAYEMWKEVITGPIYRVRFTSRVENWNGPLDIVSSGSAGKYTLTQVVYSDYKATNVVERLTMGSDVIYHPEHGHFHVSDFTAFTLLKKDATGAYVPTTKRGDKTTACIMDIQQVPWAGPELATTHTTCGADRQGLTPGWADTYSSDLFGQWIEIGSTMLADGDYAIQSVADPLNRIKESDERNNSSLGFFRVRSGAVSVTSTTTYCSQSTVKSVKVSGTAEIACVGLVSNHDYDVLWNSPTGGRIANGTASSSGAMTVTFSAPEASGGVHFIYITDTATKVQTVASLQIAPSVSITPKPVRVGSSINIVLRGFQSNEQVKVVLRRPEATDITLVTTTVDENGSNLEVPIVAPASFGSHRVDAIGLGSGATLSASITIQPRITVSMRSAQTGMKVRISLRGYSTGETVTVRINGTLWTSLVVSSVGSAGPTLGTSVVVPNLPAGSYTITGTGSTGKSSAITTFSILPPATPASIQPTPTPIPAPAAPNPTATPAASPVAG